jgi:hypothetical protein
MRVDKNGVVIIDGTFSKAEILLMKEKEPAMNNVKFKSTKPKVVRYPTLKTPKGIPTPLPQ